MDINLIKNFLTLVEEHGLSDLVENSYTCNFYDNAEVKLQGKYLSKLASKYKDRANFIIDENGFINGHLGISGISISVILT